MTGARGLGGERPWPAAILLGGYAAAVALAPTATASLVLAAPIAAVPVLWWTLRSPRAWLALFFLTALLAPPLPIAAGNAGPHPAAVFAGLGILVGVLRLGEWEFRRDLLSAALVLFLAAMAASVAPAALYSGAEIAAGSLTRVALFGISVYVFFYTARGPGRFRDVPRGFVLWIAVAAAFFACLDFYYQLPAPAGYGPQFVWLETGVFRRAQGLFYEASTLGNFCAFFLVMVALLVVRGSKHRLALAAAAAVFSTALMFSYSRASVLNVVVALATLACLHRGRRGVRRFILALAAAVAAAVAAAYTFFPAFAQLYFVRLSASLVHFLSATEGILSGRVESWSVLFGFLAGQPWHAIFGVGYKTLPYSDFIGRPVVADNMYLSLLVETGVAGLGALLLLNIAILRAGWRARHSFYGAWIFCFWIGETLQMLSGDLLTYWRVLPLYFWVLAMAVRHE